MACEFTSVVANVTRPTTKASAGKVFGGPKVTFYRSLIASQRCGKTTPWTGFAAW
jgi:hypothetical protein